jgi:hypothetical protein
MLKRANMFQRILNSYEIFENTLDVSYSRSRIRQKYLIVNGDCTKSL